MEDKVLGNVGENSGIRKKAFRVLIVSFVLIVLMLFLSAGSLMYWQAWVFIFVFFGNAVFVMFYFLSRNPEFIERRLRHREKEKEQKKIISYGWLFFVVGFLIPGFDYRFGWSSVPAAVVIISDALVFAGYFFVFLVYKENSYASRIIEVEEEQKVISTGPYAVVRHPMYSGIILMYLFIPLALGSFWSLIPFAAIVPLIIFRALNEEKVLLRNLPGYKEYCKKTRYRLIPKVW